MLRCTEQCRFLSRVDQGYREEDFGWLPKDDKIYVCLVHGEIHSCASDKDCVRDKRGLCSISGRLLPTLAPYSASSSSSATAVTRTKKPCKKKPFSGVERLLSAHKVLFGIDQFQVNLEAALIGEGYQSSIIKTSRIQKCISELQKLMREMIERDAETMNPRSTQTKTDEEINTALSNAKLRFDYIHSMLVEDIEVAHVEKLKLAKVRGLANSLHSREFRDRVQEILLRHRLLG